MNSLLFWTNYLIYLDELSKDYFARLLLEELPFPFFAEGSNCLKKVITRLTVRMISVL